ncbi:MAG: amidohydrolase family protein [Candidatus Poribacteria bacterium]
MLMIIDSHCHLKHGDAQRTEYSAEAIVSVMDSVGIDKSIVFAMSTTTSHSIEMARDAVEKFPDRLIPYVYALPSYNDVVLSQLEQAISTLGFRGIKIHAGECTLAEYVIDPVIDLAGRSGVPCLIDCLGRYEAIDRMAGKFSQTKIIVAHFGQYLCKDESLIERFIRLAERYDNVSLDTSGVIIVSKIKEAVKRIGAGRVIFGIDGPHESPDLIMFARAELDKIRMLNLDPQDEIAVLGGNIANLLHI